MSVQLLLEGRSSGGPNSRDVNGYNHLMGKFSWEFVADNFDKNKTRPCRCEQPPYHYHFRCHRFIGVFFDSKMVAEVLMFADFQYHECLVDFDKKAWVSLPRHQFEKSVS